MIGVRNVTRFCVAGLLLCLVYVFAMMAGPLHSQCKCEEPSKQQQQDDQQQQKGHLTEDEKKTSHSLCLLVPFRNRFDELTEFVPAMTEFLKKQNIQHRIFVINQVDSYRFNRGSLLNSGFVLSESDPSTTCDYVAMHDVDLVPVNPLLSYEFPEKGIRHISAPGLHPKYDYSTFIGGILLISRDLFRQVNGLSNRYWGWGLEDDEFYARLREVGAEIERPVNVTTGRQNTFKHYHHPKMRPRDMAQCYNQYEVTRKRDRETGLDSVNFSVVKKVRMTIDGSDVTLINVALHCDPKETPWCDCSKAPQTDNSNRKNLKRDNDVIVPILRKRKT